MAYQPAGSTTNSSQFTHLATVWYNRTGLDVLRKKFRFRQVTEPDSIPLRSGKTVQWFRYGVFAANTTPSSEGTVGTALTPSTTTVSATVSEYSDFVSISTLLQETAIDPIVENHVKELSYRAGLSADTIARIEFDSAVTSVDEVPLGATATVQDLRKLKAILHAADIDGGPRGMDEFAVIAHPYITYDITSDNTAGGFLDVTKYMNGQNALDGEIGRAGGARIVESTNVGTSGSAPNVLYRLYFVGRGSVGSVDLPGAAPTSVTDPKKQSFNIRVIKGGPNPADPEGMIGSYASYRFVTVNKILDSTNYRYRILTPDASLV